MSKTDNSSQQDRAAPGLAVARLLAWYAEMGVTGVLDEVPHDWRGRPSGPGAGFTLADTIDVSGPAGAPSPVASVTAARPAAGRGSSPARPVRGDGPPVQPVRTFDGGHRGGGAGRTRPAGGGGATAGGAAAARVEATSLGELERELAQYEGCGLKATAKNLCLFRGAERAPLMVIGEPPGREEDIAGKPYVGDEGRLLDRMLAAIGFDESRVHITGIVYWRPPGQRQPSAAEVAACLPFLERQIALVAPRVVLVLGGLPAKHLFDTDDGIMKMRGKWRMLERGGVAVRTMPSVPPSYLLKAPLAKRQAWRDLLEVKAMLEARDAD